MDAAPCSACSPQSELLCKLAGEDGTFCSTAQGLHTGFLRKPLPPPLATRCTPCNVFGFVHRNLKTICAQCCLLKLHTLFVDALRGRLVLSSHSSVQPLGRNLASPKPSISLKVNSVNSAFLTEKATTSSSFHDLHAWPANSAM